MTDLSFIRTEVNGVAAQAAYVYRPEQQELYVAILSRDGLVVHSPDLVFAAICEHLGLDRQKLEVYLVRTTHANGHLPDGGYDIYHRRKDLDGSTLVAASASMSSTSLRLRGVDAEVLTAFAPIFALPYVEGRLFG